MLAFCLRRGSAGFSLGKSLCLRRSFCANGSALMKAVVVAKFGGPENLELKEIPRPSVKRLQEVLVRVRATAVNRADVLQRKGAYPPPEGASDIIGLEAAGEVAESAASGKWKKGDRVMALLPGGGYAQYCVAHEDHLIAIPDHFSFEEAAAIPEVWITAFQLLNHIASMQRGHYVLVHAAASGVGTAAVQLCKVAGANAIATVGSAEKAKFVKELGASECINYKTENFYERVLEITNKHGADIILDPIGAQNFQLNASSIATDGTWVLYGLMGGAKVKEFNLAFIVKQRARLICSTMRSQSDQYKSTLISSFKKEVLPKFADGTFKPIIHQKLSLQNIGEGHRIMESNQNIGKIVITVP